MALQQELEREGNWLFRYRSYLPVVMLGVEMIIFYVTLQDRDGLFYGLQEHWRVYEYACLAVSLLGVAVRIYTVGHTPANTSGRNTQHQLADQLNTTGIYSMVRHPLYFGNFLMYFGIALLVCNMEFVCVFLLVYWLYYERIMYCEEQFLQHKFGEVFIGWASHTPAFFPSFKYFEKPTFCFSWKKVLKKEKNGVFALFLIFTLFDFMVTSVHGVNSYASTNVTLLSLTIISGVIYLILKIIKKRTTLLDESGR